MSKCKREMEVKIVGNLETLSKSFVSDFLFPAPEHALYSSMNHRHIDAESIEYLRLLR